MMRMNRNETAYTMHRLYAQPPCSTGIARPLDSTGHRDGEKSIAKLFKNAMEKEGARWAR